MDHHRNQNNAILEWRHPFYKTASEPIADLGFLGAVSVESAISLDCLFDKSSDVPRAILRVVISVLLPFVVLAIGAVFWRRAIPNDLQVLKRRLILTTVVVFYISYIGWVEHLSLVLNCVNIPTGLSLQDSVSRNSWTGDTAVECFTGSHAILVGVLAVPMIVIVLLGFPIGSAIYLYQKKKSGELEEEKNVKEKFGFMYSAYTEKCVFWDCIVMLRKAALALVLAFSSSLRSNVQGLTAVCILIFCLYLQTRLMPYRKEYKTLNSLEIFSLLVCIFAFMSGLYFNDPSVSEAGRMAVSVLVVLLIGSFVICFLYDLYWKAVTYCQLSLDTDGIAYKRDDSGSRIILIWIRQRFRRMGITRNRTAS